MRKINQKNLDGIYTCIYSKNSRDMLIMIARNEPTSHTDLRHTFDRQSNLTSFHIRKLRLRGLIVKSNRYYIVTRIGMQVVKMIKAFEKACYEYDLDDCDAEGKVKLVIER